MGEDELNFFLQLLDTMSNYLDSGNIVSANIPCI